MTNLDKLCERLEAFRPEAELIHEAAATIRRLAEALEGHNDMLRACVQVIKRGGAATNWEALRDSVLGELEQHHEITNAARALTGETGNVDD